jgi:hypothetical protein
MVLGLAFVRDFPACQQAGEQETVNTPSAFGGLM